MKQCGSLKHIAIIPDGNRRWATQRGLPVRKGHEEGAKKVIEILKYCRQLNIPYVTLYAFSSENLERPAKETQFFFSILTDYLNQLANEFLEKGVHIIFIGDIASLPKNIQKSVKDCQEKSEKNSQEKNITVQVALGYGGRNEIVRAVKKINKAITACEMTVEQIDASTISKHLDTASAPDPDLLIRSGGDQRISNFLLFQMAYTEFFFTPTFWPDFSKEELDKALVDFSKRERRFGKRTLEEQQNFGDGKPNSVTAT